MNARIRRSLLIVVTTLFGCGGTPEQPDFPKLLLPGTVYVTEGQSSTFLLKVTNPPPTSELRGQIDSDVTGVGKVTVTPSEFDLSPTNYPEPITITALADSDAMDDQIGMGAAIYGDITHSFDVFIVDTDAQHVLPSTWYLTMHSADTATPSVRLTQPPVAPVTVTLQSSEPAVASVSPTTMVFGPGDYDVCQTATVTGARNGTTTIELFSQLTTTPIFVSVQ